VSFFKQSAITLFTKGGIFIISFVMNVLMARKLEAEGMGVIGAVQAFIAIAAQFAFLGLDRAAIYYIGLDKSRASKIAGNLMSAGILASIAIYIIFVLIALAFPKILGEVSFNIYLIGLLGVMPLLISLFGQNLLLAYQKIFEYNVLELIVRILSLIILAILYVTLSTSLAVIITIAVIIVTNFALGLINAGWAWKQHPYNLKIDWPVLKDMVSYGWKNYYAAVMGFLIVKSDLLFLTAFRGLDEVGVYRQVLWICDILFNIPTVFAGLLFPKLMQDGATAEFGLDERGKFTMLLSRLIGFTLSIFWVLFAIIGVWFLGIFGEEFKAGYLPLLIALAAFVFYGVHLILKVELFRRGLPAFIVIYSTVCMVVKVALNVALIPKFGMYGAAWGSLAADFLLMAFPLWYCIKYYGFNIRDSLFVRISDFKFIIDRIKIAINRNASGE
jgi:O-antigen/teichoic acid export membrane protein